MKYLIIILSVFIIESIGAQDSGMYIHANGAIINGGNGALKLQTPNEQGPNVTTLLIDGSEMVVIYSLIMKIVVGIVGLYIFRIKEEIKNF